jgi:hypothetical protein
MSHLFVKRIKYCLCKNMRARAFRRARGFEEPRDFDPFRQRCGSSVEAAGHFTTFLTMLWFHFEDTGNA